MGPYKLLLLIGPQSMELEVMGMAYAATALGWQVTLAAPRLAPLRGRQGLTLPVDAAVSDVIPERYDALCVPGGAPGDPASLALAERFAADPAHRALVTTAAGLDTLRPHAAFAALTPATKDEGVSLRGAHLTAARTGDIPALAFALDALARDRWPRPNAVAPRR
jgi:putative intracellular protease/amidase